MLTFGFSPLEETILSAVENMKAAEAKIVELGRGHAHADHGWHAAAAEILHESARRLEALWRGGWDLPRDPDKYGATPLGGAG
jgi:hypothetical protein